MAMKEVSRFPSENFHVSLGIVRDFFDGIDRFDTIASPALGLHESQRICMHVLIISGGKALAVLCAQNLFHSEIFRYRMLPEVRYFVEMILATTGRDRRSLS
jgi:hypothetical protein